MNGTIYEVIVIGAGPAGLIASYYLKHLGLEHIIFEKGRVGESWRTQRWDNFRTVTPNRMNVLPGLNSKQKNPDGFGSAKEFYTSLQDYVNSQNLPVSENSRVMKIEKERDSPLFVVEVFHDNEITRRYNCWQVIVASGGYAEMVIPSLARDLSPEIFQIHSCQYKNHSQLPDGAVLVVGAGQSGSQIALDLVDSGRKVYLSSASTSYLPRTYRGKDIMDWLLLCKSFDIRPGDKRLTDLLYELEPVISTDAERGNELSLQFLARQGTVILGKLVGASGTLVTFHSNVADSIKRADDFADSIKGMIDDFISDSQIQAPEVNEPGITEDNSLANVIWSASQFHLHDYEIGSIVWATGSTQNFGFINLPVFDQRKQLIHTNGVTPLEGIFLMGLPWQRSRKSGFIMGLKEDASFITTRIYSTLR